MSPIRIAPVALGLFLPACTTFVDVEPIYGPRFEVARFEAEGGRKETYRVDVQAGSVTLIVDTQAFEERVALGLTVEEIDKSLAEQMARRPYDGLLIRSVDDGSPADAAGIIPLDTLVSVNGQDVIYVEQFQHLVERLAAEEDVGVAVRRGGGEGQVISMKLTPKMQRVPTSGKKRHPLRTPRLSGRAYAGVYLAEVPAELSERLFGEERTTMLAGGVIVGSPAWLAGVRGGDRIVSINGKTFDDVDDLKLFIQDRGRAEDTVDFQLYRQRTGAFNAEVSLYDYGKQTDVYFPFLFKLDDSVRETDWRVGPFGMVANYEGRYERSGTREPGYHRELSMLLGLIRYDWWPTGSRTKLLWFISIGSN